MPEINKDLKRELKKEMKEIKGIERKAKAFDILMKYFDIYCKIDDINASPFKMNLCVKANFWNYAPYADTAVALVDLVNKDAMEDYRFLIKFLNNLSIEQTKNDNSEVVSSDVLREENKGMTEEENDNIDAVAKGIRFTPDNIAVKLTKSDDCNVYGSKLSDIQEINRLKDENLELKLIIGEMQHKIFKLHKELDQKD